MTHVREKSRFGPCYALGELIGETATRYLYRNRAGTEAKVELVAPQRADEIPRHLGVELYRQRLRCGEHDIWYWPVLAPCGLI